MTAQELKNSILQLAVQGKLVDYHKEHKGRKVFSSTTVEETGAELLERIRAEKAKLLAEGKIKKSHTDSGPLRGSLNKKGITVGLPNPRDNKNTIPEDEIPFDIPENWCWCRLGEIVYNHGQKTPDKDFSYIDIGSIDNINQRLNQNENIVKSSEAPSRARKIVKMGDIIYSTVRPYLHNTCIIDKEFTHEPIASTGFAVMSCANGVLNKYLFYYLLSPSFDSYVNANENSKGVAYPAINDDRLFKAVFPLPPLAEQKAIVAKIEELLPYIEKYDAAYTKLEDFNKKFPEDMQKSILQLAVQGKLLDYHKEHKVFSSSTVEETGAELLERIRAEKAKLVAEGKIKKSHTDSGPLRGSLNKKGITVGLPNPCDNKNTIPEDENASELLERIRAEKAKLAADGKIKKEKPLAPITEDEIPFDIPENWCWCRLGEISTYANTKEKITADCITPEMWTLDLEDIEKNTGRIIQKVLAKDRKIAGDKVHFEKGDILYSKLRPYLKKNLIAPSDGICSSEIVPFKLYGQINSEYILKVLICPYVDFAINSVTYGVKMPRVGTDTMQNLPIPLPPLAEQKAIVAKIEELLPLCKKLINPKASA